jgi:hypothetical protein
VATAVCDCALLFDSVWLSAGQSQKHNGTVAATDLVPNDSRFLLLWWPGARLAIFGSCVGRSAHEWTAGKWSNVTERYVRHIAGFTF